MSTEADQAGSSPDDQHPYVRPPAPKRQGGEGRSILFASIAAAVHAFAILLSVVALMIFGPRCEKVFRDFNLKPDDLTVFALAVSHWLNNYWYVLAIFLL